MKKLNFSLILGVVLLFSCQKDIEQDKKSVSTKSSANVECITFDNPNLAAGTIPTQLYTDAGSGPVGIMGIDPSAPNTNAAMIFDSDNPTGGDPDLGSPHTDFGGPGVGVGGASGATYENNTALGKILIVSEDLDGNDPDDLAGPGEFDFDFGTIGPVTVHSISLIDVEGTEGSPQVKFYDAANNLLSSFNLPTTGDNGVETVTFGPQANVDRMEVFLQGSGGIDNICIEIPQTPGDGCTHTIGYWKTHSGFGPQRDEVTQYLPIDLGTSGGSKTLEVTTNSIARGVLKQNVYGKPNNGITKLYAQLLAAKLSIADGADGTPVASVIANADNFLSNNDHKDWKSLSKNMKKTVLGWKDDLDSYNNGNSGVAHCD